MRFTAFVSLSWILFISTGCEDLIPPRPTIGKTSETESSRPAVDPSVTSNPLGEFRAEWEAWYVHRLGSQIVGLTEIRAEKPLQLDRSEGEPELVEFSRDERLLFQSGRAQFLRHTVTKSTEATDGKVKRFELKLRSGPINAAVFGARVRDRLSITWSGAVKRETVSIDWPDQAAGLFALEQTLRRLPMEAGQTRRVESLMPSLEDAGWIELRCLGDASVAMMNGDYQTLRETEAVWFQAAKPVESLVIWTNDEGVIQKTLQPATRVESFQVPERMAQRAFPTRDDQAVFVRVTPRSDPRKSPSENEGKASHFRIRLREATESEPTRSPNQWIVPLADQSIRMASGGADAATMEAWIGTGDPPDGFMRDKSRPSSRDTEPWDLIDSEHPSLRRIASSAADQATSLESTTAESALMLAQQVRNRLSLTSRDTFSTAAATLRQGQGGVFDHAIVLSGCLRAAAIPSKVVFGLVPAETAALAESSSSAATSATMKLSAWVVAWYDDRWHAIDPITAKVHPGRRLCLMETTNEKPLLSQLESLFRRLPLFDIQVLRDGV
ncbi:MAG: transglutaminase-like domain-containing protein [Planctomycetota bacterium]